MTDRSKLRRSSRQLDPVFYTINIKEVHNCGYIASICWQIPSYHCSFEYCSILVLLLILDYESTVGGISQLVCRKVSAWDIQNHR